MATQAYWDWVNAGRPWRNALPLTEMRDRIKAAVPGATIYTLGNDTTHLQVDYPQDHAPFSFSWWPSPLPGYVVTAIDYMHQPGSGLDCEALFQKWLADCRAGARPWTKYLIWQATIYDVRYGWEPQENSDHYDHIHESIRSDWCDRSIGDYDPLGDDDMFTETHGRVLDSIYAGMQALIENRRTHDAAGHHTPIRTPRGDLVASGNGIKQQMDGDSAALAASAAREVQMQAVLAALADAINKGGGNVDTARIIAHMDEVAEKDRTLVEGLQAQVGALQAELHQAHEENIALQQRLADAYKKPAA